MAAHEDAGAADGGAADRDAASVGPVEAATPPRPTGIALSGSTRSSQASPSTSGSSYVRVCQPDEVIVGYIGTAHPPDVFENWLRSFEAICASLSVAGTTSYAVEARPSETLARVGNIVGEVVQTATCPANQIVVGFTAHTGAFVDSLEFVCAPLRISNAPPYALSIGGGTTLMRVGGPRGDKLVQAQCPRGTLTVGHSGRAGDAIDSFGLLCATPSVVVQ
jgi:hypothetical protein